jgi:hypothetical protein
MRVPDGVPTTFNSVGIFWMVGTARRVRLCPPYESELNRHQQPNTDHDQRDAA